MTEHNPLIQKKKFKFYMIYTLYIALLFEFVFRGFYAFSYKDTRIFWRPFVAIDHYAPGLIKEMGATVSARNDTFDILLLGGSVLTEQWGNIPNSMKKLLTDSLPIPFEIHNLANPARTSKDSWQNFQQLENQNYDVVILYHGINEVRFNHCPPEVFKKDYSHVDYYAKVNHLINNSFFHYSIAPLVFYQFKVNILRQFAFQDYLPFHAPTTHENEKWLAYGLDVKTAPVFYNNYNQIIEFALSHNEQVITPKFIYYIPENYSLDGFDEKILDYNRHRNPVELWGSVATVTAGIDAHNENLKKIAQKFSKNKNYHYVDIDNEISKGKNNFDDLCHLTDNGSRLYAEALWPSIKKAYINQIVSKHAN